ncbi:hypothetical protein D3C87_1604400 [compost metagenome]
MVLHCPKCGLQHVDAREDLTHEVLLDESAAWDNPPHRSHLCHGCGHIWRPADVPTNGVKAIATTGKADSPLAAPVQQDAPAPSMVGDAMTCTQIDRAAQTLAACMDYPWEHMPEQGRNEMRKHAWAIVGAAISQVGDAKGGA